jgi:hypothetical protein
MAKLSTYAELAATALAADDQFPLTDQTGPSTKNIEADDLLQGLLLVSAGFAKIGATNVLSLGPNGATNPSLQVDGATASAVTGVKVLASANGSAPVASAIGSGTNVSLDLAGKGTGVVRSRSVGVETRTQTAKTDSATLTIAELLTGVIDGTPTGAAAYTLPTAALLVAGIINARVGDSFSFLVNNKSAGANTITVAAGSGGTGDGTLTVAQNVIRRFTVIVTNVTGSSEAYSVYGEGA